MSAPITIAAVQCTPLFDDVPAASAHILSCARAAVAAGARLILFPEAWLQGHSYAAEPIARRAMAIDDPAIAALARALAPLPITVIAGIFERRGARLHNSAMVLAGGAVVGCYAKHDPAEAGCAPGRERPLFDCAGWPFAISICRDTRSAALARDLAGRGARLLCYPLNNLLPPEAADQWRPRTPDCHAQRARETGCWVISADVAGHHDGWISHGSTRIYDPAGAIVAQVSEGATGMALARIGADHAPAPFRPAMSTG